MENQSLQEQLERCRLELYAAQSQILSFMARDAKANLDAILAQKGAKEAQCKFDAAANARDKPSGAAA